MMRGVFFSSFLFLLSFFILFFVLDSTVTEYCQSQFSPVVHADDAELRLFVNDHVREAFLP
jgi:hypothetical protein